MLAQPGFEPGTSHTLPKDAPVFCRNLKKEEKEHFYERFKLQTHANRHQLPCFDLYILVYTATSKRKMRGN